MEGNVNKSIPFKTSNHSIMDSRVFIGLAIVALINNNHHLARKYARIYICPGTSSVPRDEQFSESEAPNEGLQQAQF